MNRKPLSIADIESVLNNLIGDESEDEDFDENDFILDIPPISFVEDADDDVDSFEDITDAPEPHSYIAPTPQNLRNIIWKKSSLNTPENITEFQGNSELNAELLNLESPYEFFQYFFSKELLEFISNQSNLYAVQKNPERPVSLNETDIKQYIGIMFYMSLVRMPNVRSYWNSDLEFTKISQVMTSKRFEKIRELLHFNNNDDFKPPSHLDHDRLFKIRPILDMLLRKFNSIPLEEQLSIDEQMCSTKVRHYMKQYMPMKPHKWGFKFFVLSGVSGFAYNFEIYSGQETARPQSDIGATANIVLRLSEIIPKNNNYKLYHDNFYTGIPLMLHLSKLGIQSLETICRNSIPNCKLPSETDMKKEKRGSSTEYVTTIDGVDISAVLWKENKCVTVLSSFVGSQPGVEAEYF